MYGTMGQIRAHLPPPGQIRPAGVFVLKKAKVMSEILFSYSSYVMQLLAPLLCRWGGGLFDGWFWRFILGPDALPGANLYFYSLAGGIEWLIAPPSREIVTGVQRLDSFFLNNYLIY